MKICLIEDDLLLGRAILNFLTDAGHSVSWARLVADARRMLSADCFDAALLDLGLPDGEGVGFVRELRHGKNTLPILIITARDTLSERLNGLDAGADDYLIKPFDNDELLARLRAVLRRGSQWSDKEPSLFIGDLKLDEQAVNVTKGDKKLNLSPIEFALLRELLRNKNRVRTRRQLEATAMPDSESQSLDAHFSNLRKKIGSGIVRTVRGVGYIIDESDSEQGR